MSFRHDIEDLIAEFRGIPPEESFMVDKGTKPVSSILETCFEKYNIGKETPQEKIMLNWKRIVGERFAHRCAPEKIDRSHILVIKVNNTTLRRELHFMEDRIMTAIRSIEGCDHIRGIAFKAG